MLRDEYKYPNGKPISVVRKEDIINCIEDNIIDKDIALDIIAQIELSAADTLLRGRECQIPSLGKFRYKLKTYNELHNKEHKEVCAAAKEVLSHSEYVMFRRQKSIEDFIKEKREKYNKWLITTNSRKYNDVYMSLCKRKGITFANAMILCLGDFKQDEEDMNYDNYTDNVNE